MWQSDVDPELVEEKEHMAKKTVEAKKPRGIKPGTVTKNSIKKLHKDALHVVAVLARLLEQWEK